MLQGQQVGNKKLQPFQQIQLKRTPKDKKSETTIKIEAPDLKHRLSDVNLLSAEQKEDEYNRGNTLSPNYLDSRDSTQLEKRNSSDGSPNMRVFWGNF